MAVDKMKLIAMPSMENSKIYTFILNPHKLKLGVREFIDATC
jgi:hypothetical protein